ncbi:MAG TPA: antibiotic biosynthesis monooxygenase family protein [Actinospica sp.]|nr:antibiotic biosynthesis monooxygenase family protein [Actinospica sp.]
MGKSTILTAARFTVDEDQRAEFETAIAELTARAEREAGTLMYRFYRGDAGQYSVIEEYEDAAAVLAHQAANEDLLARVDACTDKIALDVHGPVGPVIREWARRTRNVTLYEEPVLQS